MASLITIFREIPDPRCGNAQRHELLDILTIALVASVCGAESCVNFAEFGEDREPLLREFMRLEKGLPSHDTFSRVFRLLDPAAEDQHDALSASVDAEIHRSAAEEARRVRQEIALLRHRPEHRARALSAELTDAEEAFDRQRGKAEAVEIDRFDRLCGTARRALRTQDFEAVERALREMNGLRFGVLFRDPDFLLGLAAHLAQQRYSAIDKSLHDRLVAQAEQAIARQDIAALRAVIGQFFENRIATGGGKEGLHELADLLGA